ncbi:phenylacetate--CoA ligase family protein [Streptacidiphilus fuscans]|uniref:Phenylacetate--CoA ligase family protein n=1 Tax=Streptacidiphilus fuscans TaxID=2789292 RepID=A0A931BFQ7_9ACTN|nr:phenylacetate--CoA ligase family protein [Streptacidiphilus fuscans]MBF9073298.1 phenylacetate--CoA ligase family protein [Streptacidiphilus fuscans]
MRYFPTDLLLAVEHAECDLAAVPDSALARLLDGAGLTGLSRFFDSVQLGAGLDELFGGLSQYPWQSVVDGNDVYELTPVGTVVLDDHRAGNTLRGLLLGWATGNKVVIRTERADFWRELVALLRRAEVPLPEAEILGPQADVAGSPVRVPDLLPVLPGNATLPGWFDAELYATDETAATVEPAGATVLRTRLTGELAGAAESAVQDDPLAATVLIGDCRAEWTHGLSHRVYWRGTTLSAARGMDAEEQQPRLDAKLRYLVQQARHTPYYRDLPRVGGLSELGSLPILDKAALDAHSLPTSRDLSSPGPRTGEVLRSGASSGAPRYIAYSRTDWENMIREAAPLFYAMGLAPGDRLINTLYGGGLYGGLSTTLCELSRMPLECYSTAQNVSVDDILMLCQSFSANALLGLPVLIMPLLREAKARRPQLRIQKVLYGGTAMSESDKSWLREQLGTEVITSVLAANDGAQLGYQCDALGGTLHHVNPDYNLIEVVDENGAPVAPGECGELLITTLQKFEGPLIRYRIGDLGRIVEQDCACGVSGQVLEYLGRADGLIKVKGATVTHTEVVESLARYQPSQVQLVVESNEGRESIAIRIESSQPLDVREVREHLMSEIKTLDSDHRFDGSLDVFEFTVEHCPEGGIERNAVSGKIKTVIDRRLVTA